MNLEISVLLLMILLITVAWVSTLPLIVALIVPVGVTVVVGRGKRWLLLLGGKPDSDPAIVELVAHVGHLGKHGVECLVERQGDIRRELYVQEDGQLLKLLKHACHALL